MELKFHEESIEMYECGSEHLVNGFVMQCKRRTGTIVAIPRGLHWFDNKLTFDEYQFGATLSICESHRSRLKIQFQELLSHV